MTFITKNDGNGKIDITITGAKRDAQDGKPRYDLVGHHGLRRLAELMARGAAHYGERNWERGQELSRTYASLLRHAHAVPLDQIEDHLAAVAFNAFSMIHVIEEVAAGRLPKELLDLGLYAEHKSDAALSSLETVQLLVLNFLTENAGLTFSSATLHNRIAPTMSIPDFNSRVAFLWTTGRIEGFSTEPDGEYVYYVGKDEPEGEEIEDDEHRCSNCGHREGSCRGWTDCGESSEDLDESSDGGWTDTPYEYNSESEDSFWDTEELYDTD